VPVIDASTAPPAVQTSTRWRSRAPRGARDEEHVRRTMGREPRRDAFLVERPFRAARMEHVPRAANSCWCGWADGRARVQRRFPPPRVIVRTMAVYGVPEHVRVTGGTEAENARLSPRCARCCMTRSSARLTIAGVGLIGGFARAAVRPRASRRGGGPSVDGSRTYALAEERGLADRGTRDPATAVAGAGRHRDAEPVRHVRRPRRGLPPDSAGGALLTTWGA